MNLHLVGLFGLAGCYYGSTPSLTGEEGELTDAQISSSEFPCEVASVLSTCWGCHVTPLRGGAPFPLTTRAELMAPSAVQTGATVADRSVIRMRDRATPMPPFGRPRPDGSAIDAFAAWVTAGMPPGNCTDAVQPPDAGCDGGIAPEPTVCTSGMFSPAGESPDMNPGLPCRTCHLAEKPSKAFAFMGTVFPTLHEQDRCYSSVPAGTRVEILDANGVVRVTMAVRARGNFMSSSLSAGFTGPFTARVVLPAGSVTQMMTPQTNGDCNACHSEQGTLGAPGRILLPTP